MPSAQSSEEYFDSFGRVFIHHPRFPGKASLPPRRSGSGSLLRGHSAAPPRFEVLGGYAASGLLRYPHSVK